jgi:type VI secretion system secreted protein VgrG
VELSREVQTGRVALTSYDFEKPSVALDTNAAHPRSHSLADYEQFDFQGEYTLKSDGQQLADNRTEELAARHERWPAAPMRKLLPRAMSLS